MTATEELRSILDEHGVKWRRGAKWWAFESCIDPDTITVWSTGEILWTAVEGEGGVWLDATTAGEKPLKPADAAGAILGRGTCDMRLREDIQGHAYQDTYECSECGEQIVRETFMGASEPPRFCPECGREVDA